MAQRSEKVKRYIEDTGLPFNILIDQSRDVIKAYGVWHRIGLDAWNIARPALFLIDRAGMIRYAFRANHQDEFPGFGDIIKEVDNAERGTANTERAGELGMAHPELDTRE